MVRLSWMQVTASSVVAGIFPFLLGIRIGASSSIRTSSVLSITDSYGHHQDVVDLTTRSRRKPLLGSSVIKVDDTVLEALIHPALLANGKNVNQQVAIIVFGGVINTSYPNEVSKQAKTVTDAAARIVSEHNAVSASTVVEVATRAAVSSLSWKNDKNRTAACENAVLLSSCSFCSSTCSSSPGSCSQLSASQDKNQGESTLPAFALTEQEQGNAITPNSAQVSGDKDSGPAAVRMQQVKFDSPEDAVAWFRGQHYDSNEGNNKFDVVILLNTPRDWLFSSSLSQLQLLPAVELQDEFVAALVDSLDKDAGVLVMLGREVRKTKTSFQSLSSFFRFANRLKSHGMKSMKSYSAPLLQGQEQEIHIAFRTESSMSRFFREPAWVDLQVTKRQLGTSLSSLNGDLVLLPLQGLDGATMALYQYPSRLQEDLYCQVKLAGSEDVCEEWDVCRDVTRGLDPDWINIPRQNIVVKNSHVPNAGRGVFLHQNAPAGAMLAAEDAVHAIHLMPNSWALFLRMHRSEVSQHLFDILEAYLNGYGYSVFYYGEMSFSVEPNYASFINHGCNGTNVIDSQWNNMTEQVVDPKNPPDGWFDDQHFFNLFIDRNHFSLEHAVHLSSDVNAGEELLGNYLVYLDKDKWEEGVKKLKSFCGSMLYRNGNGTNSKMTVAGGSSGETTLTN